MLPRWSALQLLGQDPARSRAGNMTGSASRSWSSSALAAHLRGLVREEGEEPLLALAPTLSLLTQVRLLVRVITGIETSLC